MLRRIGIFLIVILLVLIGWHWQLLVYGWYQAKGQIEVIMNAKPIEHFLADPDFPDSLKQKLRLAAEVRTFAMEELKLNPSDNYTKLYDQKGKTILWNLSACEAYELKPYSWNFPFLGGMPYKGFFDLEKAKKEQKELDTLGYDTRIRPVSGWSTLGILTDPILSNMLERSDGALAEVIIHELTHATIFVKNEVEFNENLASFIGERGAELFLKKKFGDYSQALIDYKNALHDGSQLTKHVLRGAKALDTLYKQIAEQPIVVKDSLKQQTINKIVSSLDTVTFYHENFYYLFDRGTPNNAYFMSFMRYHAQEDTLTSIYKKHDENLIQMLESMKQLYGK